jgi:hypothetical protein
VTIQKRFLGYCQHNVNPFFLPFIAQLLATKWINRWIQKGKENNDPSYKTFSPQ